MALAAAFIISAIATPAGISGAVLLLPFQVSVLGTPSPAVTPTNLLYNVVSTPGALYRYRRQHQTGWRLALSPHHRDPARRDRTVINGPFAESKELVAGYRILQVKSMDEAVEWAKRAPFEALSRIYPGEYGAMGEIEIR